MTAKTRRISYGTVALYILTGGRADRGRDAQAGFLKLTTTGRTSGQPRTTSLIYLRDGADYALTASNGGKDSDPGWFYNLRANPQVTITVHGQRLAATAEVASPEKRRELWARLVAIAPMYLGYERHTQREIPMVIIHPSGVA